MQNINNHINSIKTHFGKKQLALLFDDDVIELMLNSDGSLWVERFGLPMKIESKLTNTQATLLIKSLASYHDIHIRKDNPILECEFPIDGSRFCGVMPPVSPVAPIFALRKKAIRVFSLDDYFGVGIISKNQFDVLRESIINKKNILIVGGTGSGKTTLANAFIKEIAINCIHERIFIIEDTNEIQCESPNAVILRSNIDTPIPNILKATLRLRPDRIIVGEVRGGEALTLLKAWNTGHTGGIATIHANDAKLGLKRLESCISEASLTIDHELIAESVNLVVYIEKTSTGRLVKEIIKVKGYKNGYITEAI